MSISAHTLLLSRTKVAELATTRDYLASMRTAFADLADQRYALPRVGHIPADGGAFHIKAAARRGPVSLAVVKVNGNFPHNPFKHHLPTIQGFIALLDAERGSVLALMDSTEVTARRTAAATALATEYLAKAGSSKLGIVGCGMQARYHVEALLDVAPIEYVSFYDPRDEAAGAFSRYAMDLGIKANRVSEARAVAHGADIVLTVTTATQPVLELADIEPGTFVAGVGADDPSKHELGADLLRGSRVIVDLLAQSSIHDEHH